MNTPTVTIAVTGDPANDTVANVEAESSGWSLKITRTGKRFNAELTGPLDGGFEMHNWASVPRVLESVSAYLRARGLSHIATALRESVECESGGL